ncbi:hypothetical protein SDC9_195025 [bioreactor metagenome]|uniref:Uncharacterized protein n=1 Tax=bioreactor metagenome TaxID=1076179 RepID=A0A645IJC1_9ZZZZ
MGEQAEILEHHRNLFAPKLCNPVAVIGDDVFPVHDDLARRRAV